MTDTEGGRSAHRIAADLARGFLAGGLIGASLAAFVAGSATGNVGLAVAAALAVPVLFVLFHVLVTLPRRARETAVAPRTALAMIEALEVVDGPGAEDTDARVRFDLTVAPDDRPAYRVLATQVVNRNDLRDYRPGGVLVVRYPPERPLDVGIVKRPTPEWEARAAGADLDSAPGPARSGGREGGWAEAVVTLLGLVSGAAGTAVLLHRRPAPDVDGRLQIGLHGYLAVWCAL